MTDISVFVMRLLGVYSGELKARVRRFLRLTTTRMKLLGAGEWDPWVYMDHVVVKVESSLDCLYAKVGLLRRTSTPCLQCGGEGEQEGRERMEKFEEELEEIRGETFRLARAK